MSLATADELARALGGTTAAEDERDWLTLLIDGASNAIELEAGRIFHPLQAAEDPVGTELVELRSGYARIPDARELTTVTLNGTALELSAAGSYGYRLHARRGEPAFAIVIRAGFGTVHHAHGDLELTGRFGFSPTPPDVKLAAIQWAARGYHEVQARMADQIADPEGGAAAYFRQVPAGIKAVISRYRIPGL